MIDKKELRLGNWVECYNMIFQIGQLLPDYAIAESEEYEGVFYYEKTTPILITPDILINAGFELLPGSRGMYRIFIDDLEISVSVEFFFAYIDTDFGQAPIKKPIFKYVHSLQNLIFALTGQELTISM